MVETQLAALRGDAAAAAAAAAEKYEVLKAAKGQADAKADSGVSEGWWWWW